ncbi:TPA: hypothetical protein QDB48_005242 [Burkholderia vietnamiensis]|nr:hypothetical protein [Burkholderia vietnamiensis]
MSLFNRIRDKFKPEWEKPIDHEKELHKLFKRTPDELHAAFGDSSLLSRVGPFPEYPRVTYLGEAGLHAFVLAQHMEFPAFPRFLSIVSNGREDADFLNFKKGAHTSFVSSDREFTGRNVYLLTNDVDLIDRLAEHQFSPTPPWIAYPELGPSIAYNQGEQEYWLLTVWLPFWNGMSPEGRDLYIENRSSEALSYMSKQEWDDWVYTTRKNDPEYRRREGL